MPTIEVQSRTMGSTAPEIDPVLLEIFTERITAAELIARTVTDQVSDLMLKRRMDAEAARQILARQYLTAEEVEAQAARGAVRLPGKKRVSGELKVNTAAEIEHAQQAFTAGKFVIFCGGRQITRLDEELDFREQNKVVFLRIMPLVGG